MEKLVVNCSGWYGKIVNKNCGKSWLCPDCTIIEVEVLGYTKIMNDFDKPYYKIGNIQKCNVKQFKPYPEYIGLKCGEWIKA